MISDSMEATGMPDGDYAPVSYTHLDVYKRQDLTRADSNRAEPDLDLVPADSVAAALAMEAIRNTILKVETIWEIFLEICSKICFMGRVALAAVPAVSISKAIG